MLLDDVKRILKSHPDLTAFGFWPLVDVNMKSSMFKCMNFEDERAQLLKPRCLLQIEDCLAYLDLVGRTVTARGRTSPDSYGMKHHVEEWLRAGGRPASGSGGYITNGSFIVACLILGVPIHRPSRPSPNCAVGLRCRDVAKIEAQPGCV